jgi:hypothetical protein
MIAQTRPITVSTLLLVLLAYSQTFAQRGLPKPEIKQEPKRSFLSEPFTVKLNVWVSKQGGIVNNLAADQFVVFEDDVLQKVSAVEHRSGPLKLELVVDNSGSVRSVLDSVVGAANYLVEQLEADDQCEIIRFISSDKIEQAQTFTSDKARLKKVISEMYIEGASQQSSMLSM